MTYYVTRQAYVHDSGAFAVEIAKRLDVASPDALAEKYPGEMEGFDDPRDAARAAVRVRDLWERDMHDGTERDSGWVPFTLAASALVYPTVEDGWGTAELEEWAIAEYERLPKCERCGAPITGDVWRRFDDVGFDDAPAYCSENCVEAACAADEQPLQA